jgi:hypothetical protein
MSRTVNTLVRVVKQLSAPVDGSNLLKSTGVLNDNMPDRVCICTTESIGSPPAQEHWAADLWGMSKIIVTAQINVYKCFIGLEFSGNQGWDLEIKLTIAQGNVNRTCGIYGIIG